MIKTPGRNAQGGKAISRRGSTGHSCEIAFDSPNMNKNVFIKWTSGW